MALAQSKALKGMNKKDRDLLQDITIMMTDPEQAQNEGKINDIMLKIRQLVPSKSHNQLRLAACHFMTMYHTRKAMSIGMPQDASGGGDQMAAMMQAQGMGLPPSGGDNAINSKAVEKFKKEQKKDMQLGWDLLNINDDEDEKSNKTSRVLKIEVAQRLENSYLLKQAFEDLISDKLSPEETMVAFTAAPFLGDWKEMMKLGKSIEKMQGGLEQLHMMSLQLPIPDFTLIYELAKQYKLDEAQTPDISTLTWDIFSVKKIRVKFQDVNCGEYEEKRKELLDEITKQGDVEWEDVPNLSHVHIKRMGALCQAVSFGEIPMMLNGPWFEDKIHVKGRAEMPLMPENGQDMQMGYGGMPNPENMTILIQEEEWQLEKDNNNKNLYTGSYTLKQRPDLPPSVQMTSEHAPVNMKFFIEIHINQNNGEDIKNEDDENDDKMENEDNDQNVEDVTNKKKNKKNKKNKNKNKNNNNNNNNNDIEDDKNEDKNEDENGDENQDEVTKVTTEFDGLELD